MPKTPARHSNLPSDYPAVLAEIKDRIRSAQIRAHRAVNTEMVQLYWSIGKTILERQAGEGWGTKVIERLSADLRSAFPDQTGWSRANLHYMRAFAAAWPESVQRPVGQLPWGHITTLLDRFDDQGTRDWYATEAVRNGWSRAVLLHQIKTQLHLRAGAAPSNFAEALSPPDSELVQQMVKDPYNFGFLGLSGEVAERELEDALVQQLTTFLLELGNGFAFLGRQYPVEVEGEDFLIDLLFYHLGLRRYVVIELKVGEFRPEYAGKLNFYVNVVDDQLRREVDGDTIGILLCTDKRDGLVRYSLKGLTTPVGVASYDLLPADVQKELPPAEDLEHVVGGPIAGLHQMTVAEYLEQLARGATAEG